MSGANFSIQMILLLSAVGFILGLRMLSSPKTARLGNAIAAFGMFLAIVMTIVIANPKNVFLELAIVFLLGSILGIIAAKKVKMTEMPQMVAIFNGLGGAASVFVAASEMTRYVMDTGIVPGLDFTITSWFSVIVGGVTLSGSMFAFGKLQGLVSSRALLYPGQRVFTLLLFVTSIAAVFYLGVNPENMVVFCGCVVISLILGCLLVIPIGGADMPVVISLLNSYSGLAAMAAGFVVHSKILIIAGALVGASGVILTRIMCQAMNRSLTNVIFGAFGEIAGTDSQGEAKPMKEFLPMDAAMLFKNSSSVVFVPGYGLAVSQAQHSIRELSDLLKENGVNVFFAIHPVAGRMPGHMNVLLAEADVPYEELKDLDDANSEFETADVAVVIGANDVVNPSARSDKTSPLFGMPILNADKARTVVVLKRGRGRGFAGVENPLFVMDNSGVVFGDAKKSLTSIVNEYKQL